MTAGLTVCTTLAIALCAVKSDAASIFDPIYRFRVLPTEHFIIYFHQGEERLALRLATIAEETWRALERPLGAKPPRLTHVVLVDQTELANGYAMPVPRDTVVLTATWPPGSDFIGRTDDWLRLVFTHEFTHIVHLDRSESWARVVRGVFGRVPLAFPNLFLPIWQIEGIATYEESVITGEGRLHAGDFRAIVAEAARAQRLEPLDRVNGGLTDWPGGLAPYAYGLGFHAYLADRYGDDKFAALAEATARRVPYTASRVFKRIYGRSLGELWRDYEHSLSASPTAPTVDDDVRRLTHHGFVVAGPRFIWPACAGCPADILYSVRTPHAFPTLNSIAVDGSSPRRVATRYLGSTTAPDFRTIYFDQQELRRNTGLYSDLYTLDLASGRVRRLTKDERLIDPDLSPLTHTIVAVRSRADRRELVRLKVDPVQGEIHDITTLVSEAETQFNTPRLSPDGSMIVAERHRLGASSELVLVDTATGALRVLASDALTRWVTPTWSIESFAVIAAAAEADGPFNLYEVELLGGRRRQITHTTGGALWPVLSPDRKTIVYVGYTIEGFDLFSMSYPPATPSPIGVLMEPYKPPVIESLMAKVRAEQTAAADEALLKRRPTYAAADYSPWPTLPPTWWSPIVEGDRNQLRVGAATGGFDVLGYHAYAASASWRVSSPANAPAVSAIEPDWQFSYAYARWRPTLFATASSATSFFGGPPTDEGVPSTNTVREQQIEAGVLFPVIHTRVSHTAFASVVRAVDDFTYPDHALSRDRTAARAAWSVVSAHSYGYSISPERGVAVGLTTELVRRALGASADATAATGDARAYLPGVAPHHVLAIRFAGGTSTGDRDLRRVFLVGGAGSNPGVIDFGHEAISLLRGFPTDTFAGSHVALLNGDYRWPLARPERGAGTWPLFLHTVHAAVFADAGHAWSRAFAARDVKSAAGAELSFDVVAGYSVPFTATIGAAWGHDGSHTVADRATVYVRIGRAF